MRKLTCTLFILMTYIVNHAQLAGNENKQPVFISTYAETQNNCEKLLIPTTYSKFNCDLLPELSKLNNAFIIGIDLVYTDFPSGYSFKTLNRNRFLKLDSILKGRSLLDIPVTLYRQTRAQSKEEAEKDFHGFVIYYKNNTKELTTEKLIPAERPQDSVDVQEEVMSLSRTTDTLPVLPALADHEFIKSLIDNDFNPDSILKIKEAYVKAKDSMDYEQLYCYDKSLAEQYKKTAKKVEIIFKEVLLEKGYSKKNLLRYYKECDKFLKVTTKVPLYSPLVRFFTEDSVVTKALNRNRWNNMMVCADVTGSMSPYIVQLLVWLKLNANDSSLKHFIAFNDGDNKPQKKKKIGKTGGIYNTPSWQYKEVAGTVYTGVKNGNGGDGPENDIEALMAGEKLCKDCENFILIADNYAPVKDIQLLSKLNRPVKIILCGVHGFINTDYLNIARKTRGSIHTIEKDIINLALMKEGEIFEFGEKKYQLKGGNFIDITIIKKII
jgi:hypothetical protein